MTPPQGLVANLSTAVLTISGSLYGLPLSTTHVSVGALLGIGVATQQARWKTAIPVLLAWLITLPCAALSASVAYRLITAVSP
jgi:PiT family inorganic phosphate transporter